LVFIEKLHVNATNVRHARSTSTRRT